MVGSVDDTEDSFTDSVLNRKGARYRTTVATTPVRQSTLAEQDVGGVSAVLGPYVLRSEIDHLRRNWEFRVPTSGLLTV